MSIGATCSPIAETLGDGYKQANIDCGHNHVSPDKKIDASTCKYPEYTWFVKGNPHNKFNAPYREFITWAILFDGQPTVHSNEKYPQFNESRDIRKAVKYLNEAKEELEEKDLSAEKRAQILAAVKDVEDMLARTHNNRKADDELVEKLKELVD